MAAQKNHTAIWTAQSLAAGAANITSNPVDLSTSDGAQVDIQLTNGATGPTVPAQVQIQVANDAAGTLWANYLGPFVGPTGNGAVSSWSIELPIGVARVQLVGGSNTGQNVQADADISNVTQV